MVIDAHTHIFSDEVRSNPRKFGERDRSFNYVYVEGGARMTGREEMLAAMRESSIDVAVTCSFPWRDMTLARESNDYVLDTMASFPRNFIGFCCVNPADTDEAVKEAVRCLEAGMRGIGELHAEPQRFDPLDFKLMEPLIEVAREFGVPVMMHVNEQVGHDYIGKGGIGPKIAYKLVERFPHVDWIFPHWGGGLLFYELMPEVAEACRRVYYDTAASPFLYRKEIYVIAARVVNPGRILFGTDFPLLPYRRILADIEDSGLDEGLKRMILGENARRLLGW